MSFAVFEPTIGGANTYYLPVHGDFEAYTPFLQYEPSSNVAYGVGGVFAALVIATAAITALARARVFFVASVASASLMVSMFLRGSLHEGSATGIYVASLLLDSVGAILLLLLTMVLLAVWMAQQASTGISADEGVPPLAVLVGVVASVVAVGCIVLECTGVPLTFYHTVWYHRIGHQLHITAVATVLAASGLGLLVTLWTASTTQSVMAPLELASLAVPFGMLCVWAAYALAQAKMPLDSVANTSEVAWYLLNVLPLAMVLVLWVVSNAPRFFVLYQQQKPQKYLSDAYAGGLVRDRKSRPASYYTYPYDDEPPSYPMRLPSGHARKADTPEDKIQRAILRYA
ncbi:hypothetical protein IW140_005027 [Coemansia sp. RSA 1813]|nr:hypothetical protein EV178_005004 [Coemansia sp. RSA 1646]KAJ1764875.1 hypothetical protein LPJ74_006545 [Coemansia sp. RSA 1843]KAJ2087302.1 hypothetical protein IW138_005082 [Coemansia sp. RSA 986]KAJ2212147.1 hypothetical protein EV179_004883 [Coemansia sp. RSA 487]KAJ2566159.1 hypothetical protein IW140_005027 [Coemansia sp. RSA 1813]